MTDMENQVPENEIETAVEESANGLADNDYGIYSGGTMEIDDFHDPILEELEAGTTDADADQAPDTEPAAETTETEESAEAAPAIETEPTEATEQPQSNKLRFRYKYDREEHDAELDEAELPDIYEKALATDRYKERVGKMSATNEAAEKLARQMGYDSADEMIQAAAENFRNAEIERLTNDGVHPEVAAMLVEQRLGTVAQRGQSAPTQTPDAQTAQTDRDFAKEAGELLSVRPELRGHNLPEEVTRDAVSNGKPLLRAYLDYEAKQKQAEIEKLRKENQIYKQNAEAASRSPVKGTSGGGTTNTEPSDPFLRGLTEDYY